MSQEIQLVNSRNTMRILLENPTRKEEIRALLPKFITVERFFACVLNSIGKNPALQRCTQISFLRAVNQSAELGLLPDTPSALAHIIPFGNEAIFIVGYRGYIELAFRSGEISSIVARSVYENDFFEWEYGINENLVHKPVIGDRGEWLCVYAVTKFKGGERDPLFVVLTNSDIEKHKKSSRSAKSEYSPWQTSYPEMAEKTAIRVIAKFLPKATELQRAIQIEDGNEGIIPIIDFSPPQKSAFEVKMEQDAKVPVETDGTADNAVQNETKHRGRPAGSKNKSKDQPPPKLPADSQLSKSELPTVPPPEVPDHRFIDNVLELENKLTDDAIIEIRRHLGLEGIVLSDMTTNDLKCYATELKVKLNFLNRQTRIVSKDLNLDKE